MTSPMRQGWATEEGQRVIHGAFQQAEKRITSLLEALDPVEQETLDEGLDILRRMFEKESPVGWHEHHRKEVKQE